MSQKLFRVMLGALIVCSLTFTSIAGACSTMNNMTMSDMTMSDMSISDTAHACEMMDPQPLSSVPNQSKECCNFMSMMPCEAKDFLASSFAKKIVMDWTIPGTTINTFTLYPVVRRIDAPRLYYPSYILKSQIIYLQTSRLRI